MERTIVILHQGALAHYQVTKLEDDTYQARLQKYGGKDTDGPPDQFELRKVGRHWEDGDSDQELIDEVGKAIELMQRREGPVDPEQARRWGRDPGSF